MKTVKTDKLKSAGPYSQAVISNGIIYTSGQLPIDPISGEIKSTDIKNQTKQVIENIKTLLEVSGSSLDRVLKTTCFLKNMEDFAVFNEIYEQFFTGKPSRSCVEVSALPKCALVEIEVIAEI